MKKDLFNVAAFYSFIDLSYLLELKSEFTEFLKKQDIRGTMLIASEGINGTLAGKESSINEFKNFKHCLKKGGSASNFQMRCPNPKVETIFTRHHHLNLIEKIFGNDFLSRASTNYRPVSWRH